MNATYLHASVKQIIAAVEADILSRADAAAICEDRLSRNPTKPQTLKLAEWLAQEAQHDTKPQPKAAKPASGRTRNAKGQYVKGEGLDPKTIAKVAKTPAGEIVWTQQMLVALRGLQRLSEEEQAAVIAEAMA